MFSLIDVSITAIGVNIPPIRRECNCTYSTAHFHISDPQLSCCFHEDDILIVSEECDEGLVGRSGKKF